MFIKNDESIDSFTKQCFDMFNKLENNNQIDFHLNGEAFFLGFLKQLYVGYIEKAVIFDIGANKGEYTQILKENFSAAKKAIHVFEPTKFSFSTLRQKFSDDSEIMLNKYAVSDTEGQLKIYYDQEGSGLTSLHQRNLKEFSIQMDNYEMVDVITLEKYIYSQAIKHIHFLKMDVEGHELFGLKGLGNYLDANFIDFIQFEYGGTYLDSRTSLRDIYEILTERGFKIAKLMPNGLDIRTYSSWMDNFQYANYVAISNKLVDVWNSANREKT